jgi:hypothetical protein
MNKQYDNVNKGVLFINDRKEKDSHPDRNGSLNIDGKEYWLSGWDKQTSKGDTISLSVQPKDATKSRQNAPSNAAPANNDFDDDLPF